MSEHREASNSRGRQNSPGSSSQPRNTSTADAANNNRNDSSAIYDRKVSRDYNGSGHISSSNNNNNNSDNHDNSYLKDTKFRNTDTQSSLVIENIQNSDSYRDFEDDVKRVGTTTKFWINKRSKTCVVTFQEQKDALTALTRYQNLVWPPNDRRGEAMKPKLISNLDVSNTITRIQKAQNISRPEQEKFMQESRLHKSRSDHYENRGSRYSGSKYDRRSPERGNSRDRDRYSDRTRDRSYEKDRHHHHHSNHHQNRDDYYEQDYDRHHGSRVREHKTSRDYDRDFNSRDNNRDHSRDYNRGDNCKDNQRDSFRDNYRDNYRNNLPRENNNRDYQRDTNKNQDRKQSKDYDRDYDRDNDRDQRRSQQQHHSHSQSSSHARREQPPQQEYRSKGADRYPSEDRSGSENPQYRQSYKAQQKSSVPKRQDYVDNTYEN